MTRLKKKAYAAAGVDIALGNLVKRGLQEKVKTTFGPEVLGRIGAFGGFFRLDLQGIKDPVLVSSIDGVGTKLKIAISLGKHDSIAQDLVNHCINDIAVTGAIPLFFLDYIGAERLEPPVFNKLISGGQQMVSFHARAQFYKRKGTPGSSYATKEKKVIKTF